MKPLDPAGSQPDDGEGVAPSPDPEAPTAGDDDYQVCNECYSRPCACESSPDPERAAMELAEDIAFFLCGDNCEREDIEKVAEMIRAARKGDAR